MMKTKKPADWQKVREAYCTTAMPVQDICVRHAVASSSLYRHLKNENWPMRSDARPPDINKNLQENTPEQQGGDMVSRLSSVFQQQLQEAEAAAKSTGASATEREREGRALAVLWKNYEKLKEHEEMKSSDDSRTGVDEQAGWKSSEEERLCNEINDQLARLVRKRRAERASTKSKLKKTEFPEK